MTPPELSTTPLPRGVVKEVDGVFAKEVAGPIALAIVRRLVSTPITPNHVTLFCFMVRLTAAYLLVAGTFLQSLVAIALLLGGFVLDMVDGQLARARGAGTPLGAILDKLCDNVSETVVYVCAAAGYSARYGTGEIWPLALAAVAILLVYHLSEEMIAGQFRVDPSGESEVRGDGALTRMLRGTGIDDARQTRGWIDVVKRVLWFSVGERQVLLSLSLLVLRVDLYFWLIVWLAAPSWTLRLAERLWRLR